MTVWIILAAVVLLLAVINETDFWMPEPSDYRKLGFVSRHPDVELISGKAKKAILMIHEYAGVPGSMRELGERLHRDGWDVFIPAMPGASVSVEEYLESPKPNYRLWKSMALDRYRKIREKYAETMIVGASIGGSLALDIASEAERPAAVVTLSSPVKVTGRHFRKRFLRNAMLRLSGILSIVPANVRTGILPAKAYEISPVHGLEGISYNRSTHSMRLGTRRMGRKLRRVVCPVMALHARGDTTVDVDNVRRIVSGVSSDYVVKRVYDIPEDTLSRKHRITAHTLLKDTIYFDIKEFLSHIERMKP